jgi:hypothetical protein
LDALEDTGAPWAADAAEDDPDAADAEGEAPGFGKGLSALDTWPAEGGVAAGFAAAAVGAAGAAFWPQPANGKANSANSAMR